VVLLRVRICILRLRINERTHLWSNSLRLQTIILKESRHIHTLTLETGEPDTTVASYVQYSLDGNNWYLWYNGMATLDVTQ